MRKFKATGVAWGHWTHEVDDIYEVEDDGDEEDVFDQIRLERHTGSADMDCDDSDIKIKEIFEDEI